MIICQNYKNCKDFGCMHRRPHSSTKTDLDCCRIACHQTAEGKIEDFICVDYFKEKFKERANGK